VRVREKVGESKGEGGWVRDICVEEDTPVEETRRDDASQSRCFVLHDITTLGGTKTLLAMITKKSWRDKELSSSATTFT
jgi:hypothetical protein